MKISVMTNEITRILRNCSIDITWEETADHVSYFLKRLQFSGYSKEFRYRVLQRALSKYDKIMNPEPEVTPGEQGRGQVGRGRRSDNDEGNRSNWYSRNGRHNSVMFVEATPNAEMKKRVKRVVEKYGFRIKIVERVGTTIKGLLQKSNPLGTVRCGREKCVVCRQEVGGKCRTRGCVYEFMCLDCERLYRGQTGRSLYERTKEQVESWERGEEDCPLQRHSVLYHDGEDFQTKVKVLAECYGKPSKRLITEAVMIEEIADNSTMNSKSEWSYIKLSRVGIQ